MLRKPISTLVVSLALVLAVVILTAPYADVAEAAQPNTCVLHDGGGSAQFTPSEMPSTITRGSDSGCHVMSYELVNGRYVRRYHPCRYGNSTAKKTYNHRQAYANAPAAEPAADSASQMAESTQPAGAAAQEEPVEATTETGAEQAVPEKPETPEATATPEAESSEVMTDTAEAAATPTEVTATEVATTEVITDTVEATATSEVATPEAEQTEVMTDTAQATVETQSADEQAAAGEKAAPEDEPGDIVETAAEDMNFATLLAAAGATDLSGTLRDIGPYTVFAPNDAAFAGALPGGDLDDLLMEAGDQLAQIVLYHLVQGAYPTDVMTNGMQLETLQGSIVTVTIDGDTYMVNDANIVTPNLTASNGVIHVIDGVLQPPKK